MEKYLIEYTTKMGNEYRKLYHQSIATNDSVGNVYYESLTSEIKSATIFYNKKEADKVSNFFSSAYHVPNIITQ